MEEFDGAKLALIAEDRILTMLRDDIPTIVYPGMWDLPGGGREGNETPEQTVLRETREETSLAVPEALLTWKKVYPSTEESLGRTWFFAARVGADWIGKERLGDEGQTLEWMPLEQFLSHPKVIRVMAARVRAYLNAHPD